MTRRNAGCKTQTKPWGMNKKRWIDFYFQLIYITSERVEGSKAICYLASFMHSVILGYITEETKSNKYTSIEIKKCCRRHKKLSRFSKANLTSLRARFKIIINILNKNNNENQMGASANLCFSQFTPPTGAWGSSGCHHRRLAAMLRGRGGWWGQYKERRPWSKRPI